MVSKQRPNEEVKSFLRDVLYFQKKNRVGRYADERNQPGQAGSDVEDLESESKDLFGDQVVPADIRPFMDQEVNFKLYTELLIKKSDL